MSFEEDVKQLVDHVYGDYDEVKERLETATEIIKLYNDQVDYYKSQLAGSWIGVRHAGRQFIEGASTPENKTNIENSL